jgi:hypothetical protein
MRLIFLALPLMDERGRIQFLCEKTHKSAL